MWSNFNFSFAETVLQQKCSQFQGILQEMTRNDQHCSITRKKSPAWAGLDLILPDSIFSLWFYFARVHHICEHRIDGTRISGLAVATLLTTAHIASKIHNAHRFGWIIASSLIFHIAHAPLGVNSSSISVNRELIGNVVDANLARYGTVGIVVAAAYAGARWCKASFGHVALESCRANPVDVITHFANLQICDRWNNVFVCGKIGTLIVGIARKSQIAIVRYIANMAGVLKQIIALYLIHIALNRGDFHSFASIVEQLGIRLLTTILWVISSRWTNLSLNDGIVVREGALNGDFLSIFAFLDDGLPGDLVNLEIRCQSATVIGAFHVAVSVLEHATDGTGLGDVVVLGNGLGADHFAGFIVDEFGTVVRPRTLCKVGCGKRGSKVAETENHCKNCKPEGQHQTWNWALYKVMLKEWKQRNWRAKIIWRSKKLKKRNLCNSISLNSPDNNLLDLEEFPLGVQVFRHKIMNLVVGQTAPAGLVHITHERSIAVDIVHLGYSGKAGFDVATAISTPAAIVTAIGARWLSSSLRWCWTIVSDRYTLFDSVGFGCGHSLIHGLDWNGFLTFDSWSMGWLVAFWGVVGGRVRKVGWRIRWDFIFETSENLWYKGICCYHKILSTIYSVKYFIISYVWPLAKRQLLSISISFFSTFVLINLEWYKIVIWQSSIS